MPPSIMKCGKSVLFFVGYVALTTGTFWVAPSVSRAASMPKELTRNELSQARALRDVADELISDFTERFRWEDGQKTHRFRAPNSIEGEAAAVKVEEALTDVISRYKGSEVAAYCSLRLSGFRAYRRDLESAIKLADEVATSFPETLYAAKAHLHAGMLELQGRQHPDAALVHFQKIIAEPAGPYSGVSEINQLYMAAQVQIARIEIQGGQINRGEKRAQRVKSMQPDATKYTDRIIDRTKQESEDLKRLSNQVAVLDLIDREPVPVNVAEVALQKEGEVPPQTRARQLGGILFIVLGMSLIVAGFHLHKSSKKGMA